MKKTVLAIVSLFLFFATSLGAIAVAGGYLSLSDESGEQTAGTSTADPSGKDPSQEVTQGVLKPGSDSKPGVQPFAPVYVTNLKGAIRFSDVEGLTDDRGQVALSKRTELYSKLAGDIGGYDGESDLISSSGVYSEGAYEIKLLQSGLYDEYTSGTEVITKYNKVYSSYDASYITHSTAITRERCKIIPYMGYLLVSNIDASGDMFISLCSPDGTVIVENMGDKVPYYARDYSNNPVFTDSNGKFYYHDGEKFASVSREKIRSELFYDYPARPLAEYNGTTEVKYLTSYGQYRFVNYTNGKNLMSTRYQYAFNFSQNGLAVAMKTTLNVVNIINTSGKSMLGSSAWKIFPGTTGYVQYVYTLPDTLGIESIGCSGFDNGWLRLRIQAQSRMSNSYGTIAEDVERLINAEGEYFDIPDGYTLEGYSNGVLLLSKEGLYGYYSINGYWIAQPIYDYARPFIQGLAVVGCENGTVGMIDTEGNIVLPFVFTHISDVSSGIISAYTEGVGWNVYTLCEKQTEN